MPKEIVLEARPGFKRITTERDGELTREEKLEAALAELQEREAARDKNWQPKHDLRKPVK